MSGGAERRVEGSGWRLFVQLGWMAPLLMVVTFAVAYLMMPYRGMGEPGLWLGAASDNVLGWLQGHGSVDGFWGTGTADATWRAHAASPPMMAFVVGLLRLLAPGLSFSEAAHAVSAGCLALTIPMVWGLGRRSGGPPAAAAAVFAFLLMPRVLGHGTMGGYSAMAICDVTFAVYALYRARTSRIWTAAAMPAVAMATLSTHVAPLLIVPWVILTFSDKGKVSTFLASRGTDTSAPDGYVLPASFPLRLLLIPVGGLALTLALYPWFWTDTTGRVFEYFTHFLEQAKPVYLYFGDQITTDRLPWHASLVILLSTVPATTCALGVFGVFGEMLMRPLLKMKVGPTIRRMLVIQPDPEAAGPEAHEAKRWSFAFLVMALALPWLYGAPMMGGVDLIALAVPFFAVFAGCTVSRLFSVTSTYVRAIATRATPTEPSWTERFQRFGIPVLLPLFGVLVFFPSILDSVRAQPVAESYYSWYVGGTPGACAMGLPRNAYGPVPIAVAGLLGARERGKPKGVAALLEDRSLERIVARYTRDGLIEANPRWQEVHGADLLLLHHDDMDARYYDAASDFARLVRPVQTLALRGNTVRLYSIGRLKAPEKKRRKKKTKESR